MKLWGRKIFVILISVLTLGLYIPPTELAAESAEKEMTSEDSSEEKEIPLSIEEPLIDESSIETENLDEDPVDIIMAQAKEQTITKMGPKILDKIDAEMTEEILPKIEEVVEMLLTKADEQAPYYEITEQLTPGYGEKIFNLYNHRTNEEEARFHVRRDKRPGEGYWFNFHYHLSEDNFTKHHFIGEIYWEKNTPPKWMS
ncbi:YpjP family protein [Halobacillus halophilus]|uniref:YpjP family protein n=1 Tax=Halobacillus halophilus TaxID=1570 RepID=UPI001CD2950D|nr:YpjP family protein [Halobacillus halophilus]MCA1011151.1 YpjP family protein [Halobacillus halophilus]